MISHWSPATGRGGGRSRRHGVHPARRLRGAEHARARRRGGREYHDLDEMPKRVA